MKKRGIVLLWVLMAMTLVAYGCSETGEEATGSAAATADTGDGTGESSHQVATFSVQDLDQDVTIKLTAALAKNEGVMSAQAVPEEGLYKVAFRSDETTPEAVLAVMIEAYPQISLRGVVEAKGGEGGKHACGGCPMAGNCAESH